MDQDLVSLKYNEKVSLRKKGQNIIGIQQKIITYTEINGSCFMNIRNNKTLIYFFLDLYTFRMINF